MKPINIKPKAATNIPKAIRYGRGFLSLSQPIIGCIIEDTKHEANTRYETSMLEDNTLCANITASAALTEPWHISVAKCPETSKKFSGSSRNCWKTER